MACGQATDNESSTPVDAEEALMGHHDEGAVFTMSNAAAGNTVLAFRRMQDGSLETAGEYPTGGLGSGAGLGSQGSVTLTEDAHYLLVVNAGSDEISSFSVRGAELTLRSRLPSGGSHPTSVAVRNHLAYVLNAGQDSNISGFWLDPGGRLFAIPGSSRALSTPMPSAAQVAIAPKGRGVVVTEKGTSLIDTFALRRNGTLDNAVTHASSGSTPYGFDISEDGTLVVSEAAAGAASSYALKRNGGFSTISGSVADNQKAPCWLVITKDGRFAYTANAGSSSISGYQVAKDGSLQLLDANGVTASTGENGKPLDVAVDSNKHLYVVDAGNHAIDGFAIGNMGALTPVASAAGMPETMVGLAAF
jgi:6-phosphogluconolactonase (cycloisomerase 2 family)